MSEVCNSIIDNEKSINDNDNTNMVKAIISNLVFENEMESNLTKYDIESSNDNVPINYTTENTMIMDLWDLDEGTSNLIKRPVGIQ
jgi:hypothetical protein